MGLKKRGGVMPSQWGNEVERFLIIINLDVLTVDAHNFRSCFEIVSAIPYIL